MEKQLSTILKGRVFDRFPELLHGFSTRKIGNTPAESNMSFKYGQREVVSAARKRFFRTLGIPEDRVICGQQCHGDSIAVVTAEHLQTKRDIPATDAMITNDRGVFLMGLVADCALVLIYDPIRKAVGLSHAGWRGTVAALTLKTVRKMEECFGTEPSDCFALISPCIGSCCYEIGEDVERIVRRRLDQPERLLIRRGDKLYFDLPRANELQLAQAGLERKNIETAGICTSCNTELFPSYRKEGENCGRFAGVIGIKEC